MVFAVAFLGALTQVATGFGFAIVIMALLPLMIPSDASLFLSLIFGGLMSAWLLWKNRRGIQMRYVLLPGLFSSLGALGGMFFGALSAPSFYMRLLGILLFALSIWFLFFAQRVRIKATFITGAASGILSGVLGAMFSIGGPPLVLYFSAVTEDKELYMGSLQVCFVILSVIAIAGRISLGLWPPQMDVYLVPCAAGVVCGALPGMWLHRKAGAAQLKKMIYFLMCAAGLYLSISA
jgi:uncharacterized membrane protein YfcA